MDYKEKYEIAIKQAKEELKACGDLDCDAAKLIFRFFPELKESEGERIRKEIIEVFKSLGDGKIPVDINYADIFTWLEKQGEQNLVNTDLDELVIQLEETIGTSPHSRETIKDFFQKVAQKYMNCLKIASGEIESLIEENYRLKEKQGEQKPVFGMKTPEESLGIDSETYNKIVDECIYGEQKPVKFKPLFKVGDVIKPKDPVLGEPRIIKGIHPKFGYYTNNGILDFEFENNWELVEQKTADKVEPKFEVGDFIVNNYCMGRVLKLTNDAYLLDTEQGIPFSCHSTRLWDITKDAKDGDVLTDKQNCTCIFREIMTDDEGETFVDAYCGINIDNKFVINEKGEIWTVPEDLFPATKEQRDLLFQKMKEAGYEWDAEKKELKKISQRMISGEAKEAMYDKPVWSEEDEQMLGKCIDAASGYYSPEDKQSMKDWLRDIKDRVQPQPTSDDYGMQKQAVKEDFSTYEWGLYI